MHTVKEKKKLLNRVRRIRGQVESIERALTGEKDCAFILQTIAACRGAMNGLMAQVVEGHIREHVVDPTSATEDQLESAEELIDVLHSYIK